MEVKLKNYRCFRDAELRLTPLTVIVGANASGKSSLVRALSPDFGLQSGDSWQGRTGIDVEVLRRFDDGSALLAALKPGDDVGRVTRASSIPPTSTAYQLLALDANQLRSENQLAKASRLDRDGSNLANVFGSLTRDEQFKLSKQFCSFVSVYSDVDVLPRSAGHITLRFRDAFHAPRWYLPSEVSDGSLFTLAFLLLAHQSPPVDLLVIEDPEHGMHPFLLGEIVGLLRRLATGELTGRPMRVVLTTHSPTVLEFSEPEEVRLLQRKDDGSVDILEIPTQSKHWRNAFKVYDESLGQLWLSGGLGGTP